MARFEALEGPPELDGALEIALAPAAAAGVCLATVRPRLHLAALYGTEPGTHLGHCAARFAMALAVLAAPTLLLGGRLPVLARAVTGTDAEIAVRPGRLYALSTLGGVAGCALAGFVLVAVHLGSPATRARGT